MPSDQPSAPVNLALGKSARQSSVSEWSNHPTVEADAAGAVNGIIDGGLGFHTDMEDQPWWQVDLGDVCIVHAVKIYNRQHCAFRLIDFSLLFSIDGERWMEVYRRADHEIFGEHDLVPVVATWKNGMAARYVRVRLNRKDFLHFCQCEVFGVLVEPDAAKPLIEEFHRQLEWTEALAREKRAAFIDGREGVITELHGRAMFVDKKKYHATMIKALLRGGYEHREILMVKALVRPGDRVLDLGSAVGAVSMAAAGIVGAGNVIAIDANPEIMKDAKKNFIYNGLVEINTRVGIVRARSDIKVENETLKFYISSNFSASRIEKGDDASDIIREVDVPVLVLEDLIEKFDVNVIACDIEGDEIDLFSNTKLDRIRLIIMEIHDFKGNEAIRRMTLNLLQSGFNIDFMNTGDNIVVFKR
jgi:FkbM family methyltransferase